MNTEIQKILLKQAAYVKGKNETLDMATQLRKAADLLEADAAKSARPSNFLKQAREEKKSLFEQRQAKAQRGLDNEVYFFMHRNNWMPTSKRFNFSPKGKPEIVCTVKGSYF